MDALDAFTRANELGFQVGSLLELAQERVGTQGPWDNSALPRMVIVHPQDLWETGDLQETGHQSITEYARDFSITAWVR